MLKKGLFYFLIATVSCILVYIASWCADFFALDFFLEYGNLFFIAAIVICTGLILHKLDEMKKG